jgi:hypothetical protein
MTDRPQHLDFLFEKWPYEFGEVSARLVRGADGRSVIQLRVEMGILQMECTGRPDGTRPNGFGTFLDSLRSAAQPAGPPFELDEQQCLEIDREFVQYFHRRIAWLAVRDFDEAVADADHTLALMDFCAEHSPDEAWTDMHEQYRPFVLFHRTQAEALATLARADAAAAIVEIDAGIQRIRDALVFDGVPDVADDDDELIANLVEMKATISEQYELQPSLGQRLADAIAAEQYELAARLRDQMRRSRRRRS